MRGTSFVQRTSSPNLSGIYEMAKHEYPFSLCLKGAAGLDYELECLARARITPEVREKGSNLLIEAATVQIEEICTFGPDGKPVKHITIDSMFWNNRQLGEAAYADWKAGQG